MALDTPINCAEQMKHCTRLAKLYLVTKSLHSGNGETVLFPKVNTPTSSPLCCQAISCMSFESVSCAELNNVYFKAL